MDNYARFKSSGLSVMDFCSNEYNRPKTLLWVAFQAVTQRRLYPNENKQ